MKGNDKLTITVSIEKHDGTGPLYVKVEPFKAPGTGKAKIEWVKKNTSDNFTMIGFAPYMPLGSTEPNPFKNIEVKDNKIKCKYEPDTNTPKDFEFRYILAAEQSGVAYNSDDPADTTHGNAVIRN